MIIDQKTLRSAAYAADIEPDAENEVSGAYLMQRYSGRNMYGRSCAGVVGTLGDAIRFVLELADQDVDVGAMGEPCMDNMGRDAIVYWPDVQAGPDEV